MYCYIILYSLCPQQYHDETIAKKIIFNMKIFTIVNVCISV